MATPMVSMELDDESKLDTPQPIPMDNKPDYPYGLRICLTHEELAKLDLDPADAFVGGIIHLHALARITSVNASDSAPGPYSDGGPQCRIELQIEDMSIESEDAENDGDD